MGVFAALHMPACIKRRYSAVPKNCRFWGTADMWRSSAARPNDANDPQRSLAEPNFRTDGHGRQHGSGHHPSRANAALPTRSPPPADGFP
jgi:hypothetical protein